jgi:hypothetical protein
MTHCVGRVLHEGVRRCRWSPVADEDDTSIERYLAPHWCRSRAALPSRRAGEQGGSAVERYVAPVRPQRDPEPSICIRGPLARACQVLRSGFPVREHSGRS